LSIAIEEKARKKMSGPKKTEKENSNKTNKQIRKANKHQQHQHREYHKKKENRKDSYSTSPILRYQFSKYAIHR